MTKHSPHGLRSLGEGWRDSEGKGMRVGAGPPPLTREAGNHHMNPPDATGQQTMQASGIQTEPDGPIGLVWLLDHPSQRHNVQRNPHFESQESLGGFST